MTSEEASAGMCKLLYEIGLFVLNWALKQIRIEPQDSGLLYRVHSFRDENYI